MGRVELIEPQLTKALEDIKTALNKKGFELRDVRASDVPGYIRQIEVVKYNLTIHAPEFEGEELTVSQNDDVYVVTVTNGQAETKLKYEGTWRVASRAGDYEDVTVELGTRDYEITVVKRMLELSVSEITQDSIIVSIDSEVGKNINEPVVTLKKNDAPTETVADIGSDQITITGLGYYSTTAVFRVEYQLGDEIRGSVEFRMDSVTGSGRIDDGFEEYPLHIVFTDQKAPKDASLIDWSADGDMGIVEWLDQETDTLYVSTQIKGKKVIIKNAGYLFHKDWDGNNKTISIDMSNADLSRTTSMYFMFCGCSALQAINLSEMDAKNVTDLGGAFGECTSLVTVNMKNLKVGKISSVRGLFSECTSLESVDLTGLDVSKCSAYNLDDVFSKCSSLSKIVASNWTDTNSYISEVSDMFKTCTSLPNWSADKISGRYAKSIAEGGYFTPPEEA